MGERDNLAVPYFFGFAAVTIAAVTILGLPTPSTIIPFQNHEIRTRFDFGKPWEQQGGTTSSVLEVDREVFDQIEIIQTFADNLLDEIIDLDPKIVKVVNDNFWDLLA